jgi:hypothetical protein
MFFFFQAHGALKNNFASNRGQFSAQAFAKNGLLYLSAPPGYPLQCRL